MQKQEQEKKSIQSARSAVCSLHGLRFGVTRLYRPNDFPQNASAKATRFTNL